MSSAPNADANGTTPTKPTALSLARTAKRLFLHDRPLAAARLFRRAYALSHQAGLLYSAGRAAQAAGDHDQALGDYTAVLAMEGVTASVRVRARRQLLQLTRTALSRPRMRRAQATPSSPVQSPRTQPRPKPHPSSTPASRITWATVTTATLAVAGLGASAIFGALWLREDRALASYRDEAGGWVDLSLATARRRVSANNNRAMTAWASATAGAISAALAAWLWQRSARRSAPEAHLWWTPSEMTAQLQVRF